MPDRDALTVIAEALAKRSQLGVKDAKAILAALSPDGGPVLIVEGRVVAVHRIPVIDDDDVDFMAWVEDSDV